MYGNTINTFDTYGMGENWYLKWSYTTDYDHIVILGMSTHNPLFSIKYVLLCHHQH